MKITEVGASRGVFDAHLNLEGVEIEISTNTFTDKLTMTPKIALHLIEALQEMVQ